MTTKFTPGPWRVGADLVKICLDGDNPQKFTSNGWAKCVAKVTSPEWMDGQQSFHNAHLIAAAPELYEALVCLLEVHGYAYPSREAMNEAINKATDDAQLALAKARGETQ